MQLLHSLDYASSSDGFRHADRQAVFCGDFIDRGPQIREVLQIVRQMEQSGAAIAVMGSAFGAAVGMLISPLSGNLLRKFLVAYVPSGAIARPDIGIALTAFALCTVIGVACSLYPAFRAAKIVPMEVLRNE